jgi:hypothetical protein
MMNRAMLLLACSLCVLSMPGCSKKAAGDAAVQIGAAAIAALVSKSVEASPAIEVASAPSGVGNPDLTLKTGAEAASEPDGTEDFSASAALAQAVAASCEPGTELDGYVLAKCEVLSGAPSEVELTFVAHEASDMDAVVAELVAGLMLCHDGGVAQIVNAGVAFRVKVSDHTGSDVKEFVVRTCGT